MDGALSSQFTYNDGVGNGGISGPNTLMMNDG